MENLTSPETGDEQAAPAQDNSFGDILSEFEQQHHGPAAGEAIEGTVVSITPDAVFVDIGRKMDGTLPVELFRDDSGKVNVQLGVRLMVTITGANDGSYTLSTVKAARPKDWSSLEKAFAEQRAISGVVSELVKGGLRVDVGVTAFMPASRSGAKDQAELEKLVGQEIECRIIKLDTADEDVVVDRRAVLDEHEKRARERRFGELAEGAVVRGAVRSVTDFGAFVDLGGVDGLLHVTDMAWHRVAKPSDAVAVGQEVEVKILKINPETRRISLGMKQLTADPWTLVSDRFQIGQRVQGKVSRLADFGAFVELAPGVDGLIHVSEMSWSKKSKKPSELLKAGEMVEVLVLELDQERRRIKLGIKQLQPTTIDEYIGEHQVGEPVTGRVVEAERGKAKVELGDGVMADCRFPEPAEEPVADTPASGKADLTSLTAMLSAKWKQGASPAKSKPEPLKSGQIRSFKIVKLDAGSKTIEVELAG